MQINRRWLAAGAAVCLVGAAAGVWLLLHPAAFWLKPWRPEAHQFDHRIIFGPYPIEADFRALQQQGVTTIISLLDADLPYEAVLLRQEQELATKYGMQVKNYPIKSILGQGFGKDYAKMSKAAAQAARESLGVVYIHCYLGLHRAANVRKLLVADRATASYKGAFNPERSADRLALDRASAAFRENRPQDTLKELGTMSALTPEARLLGAWANLRLNQVAAARADFAQVAHERPDLPDAATGLGYCALRSDDLDEAERQFQRVLAKAPNDLFAAEGLGYVRDRQGRRDEARALLEKVLAHNPDHAEVRQVLERLRAPR